VRSFYESLAAYAHGRLGPRDFLDAAARDFHVVLEAGNKDGPCTLFRAILALFEDRFGADVSFACQSINQSIEQNPCVGLIHCPARTVYSFGVSLCHFWLLGLVARCLLPSFLHGRTA
jgi:hypothetical protein